MKQTGKNSVKVRTSDSGHPCFNVLLGCLGVVLGGLRVVLGGLGVGLGGLAVVLGGLGVVLGGLGVVLGGLGVVLGGRFGSTNPQDMENNGIEVPMDLNTCNPNLV